VDAQSQLGGFSHPGMALLLFTLLTAAPDARATIPPTSIYATAPHDPSPQAGAERRADETRVAPVR